MVNEAFAKRFFPGKSPLGRFFEWGGYKNVYRLSNIVGVVKDAKYGSVREPAMRRLLSQTDASIVIQDTFSQDQLVRESLIAERLLATLSGFFGLVALALASVGLYGVLNYDVVRRSKEIGIRRALGATAGEIVKMLVHQTAWVLAGGLAAGGIAAILLSRAVTAILFGLEPGDPGALLMAGAVLLAVATAATAAAASPAARATRVNPLDAIRYE